MPSPAAQRLRPESIWSPNSFVRLDARNGAWTPDCHIGKACEHKGLGQLGQHKRNLVAVVFREDDDEDFDLDFDMAADGRGEGERGGSGAAAVGAECAPRVTIRVVSECGYASICCASVLALQWCYECDACL